MVNGFIILDDGRWQPLGVTERFDAIIAAMKDLTQQLEVFAAEQNRKKELIAKISAEDLEKLMSKE